MPFQTRNPYYLRISERNVIPVYLYLDDRHLDWMSDSILQHVLADLQPFILPKMHAEASMKPAMLSRKATVETYRGENYQFCYFFRKNETHSLVLKTRNFVPQPPQSRSVVPQHPTLTPSRLQRGKRKNKATADGSPVKSLRKKRRTNGERRPPSEGDSSNVEDVENLSGEHSHLARTENPLDSDDEVTILHTSASNQSPIELDGLRDPSTAHLSTLPTLPGDTEEEEKPKLKLQLGFRGFEIYGYCLCIVVEPWPPIRAPSKPAVFTGMSSANPRPLKNQTSNKVPLFLPEQSEGACRPQIPSFLDPSFLEDSDGSDSGGMMAFSQVLNATGDIRAGAADDDEDADAEMFFGDADEVKELQ